MKNHFWNETEVERQSTGDQKRTGQNKDRDVGKGVGVGEGDY